MNGSLPTLALDPGGVPVVIVDVHGHGRELTAWGVAIADAAVALILTDGSPPTTRQTADLAAALAAGVTDAPLREDPAPAMAPCDRPPFGWWCSRKAGHPGSCPTRWRWWNLPAALRYSRLTRRR